jgi:hypothetical protein
MAFVNDATGFHLVDLTFVIVRQRASAFVAFFNGRVQASLFNVPLCNFQVLINVHGISPL